MPWSRVLAQARALIERLQDGEDTVELAVADIDVHIARLRRGMWARRTDLDGLQALGWLHWYRGQAYACTDSYLDADAERALAYQCLEPVYRADPLAVPEPMEQLFAQAATIDGPARAVIQLHTAIEAAHSLPDDADQATVEDTTQQVRSLLAVPRTVPALAGWSAFTLGGLLHCAARHDGHRQAELQQESVEYLQQAFALLGSVVEPLLGAALLARYDLHGDHQDLRQAITHYTSAVGDPSTQPSPEVFGELARALHHQYRITRAEQDLAQAVAAARIAVGTGAHPEIVAGHLQLLATFLWMRGRATGDAGSLEEAVRVAHHALERIPVHAQARGTCLLVLGRALLAWFQASGTPSVAEETIEVLRQALDHLAKADPDRAAVLGDLAGALIESHRATPAHLSRAAVLARIDEALALWRQALACPAGHEVKRLLWGNLGAGLRTRYEHTPDNRTLDEMVDAYRHALRATAQARDGSEAGAIHELGNALLVRYEARHDPRDLAEAIEAARTAATAAQADPDLRLDAAELWGNRAAAHGDWAEALQGFQVAVHALARTVTPALYRYDQERKLASRFIMTSNAAAVALHNGPDSAGQALELLEAGRGILLRTALHTGDAEGAALRTAEPKLAAELSRLDSELTSRQLSTDRRHELAAARHRTVTSIRRRPGFERFLLPPTAEQARLAATDGPVITINVSHFRCDALILAGSELTTIPLTGLRHADLIHHCEQFAQALPAAESTSAGLLASLRAQDTLRTTLAWLWDVLAEPVLAALNLTRPTNGHQPLPRVWWSPTGRLSSLPIHAAGHHEPGGPTVLDHVVSSYTPTVRALIVARSRTLAPPGPPARILAVGMADTPGHKPLPAALHEATALSGPTQPPLLNDQATRRAVLDALPTCHWAHFACHAHLERGYASASCLILHDQPVTITDIHRLRLTHAELAYLSACSTASAPLALAGEALHLGTAFHLAGFRHVIATLWNVHDRAAARIAADFYQRLPRLAALPNAAPAQALHDALRHARAQEPALPSRWAAHYHLGP